MSRVVQVARIGRRMARARVGVVALAALAALLSGCAAEPEAPEAAPAQAAGPAFGIDPVVSINEVMVGLVDHAAHHIWDLGREGAAPADDRDWMEVEHHAIQLAAGATFVATGGRGEPDAGWVQQLPWRDYARRVNEGAAAALAAARAKDLDGVLSAGDDIVEACEACHKEFKPALPTEGVVHPHIYEPRTQ